MRRASLAGLFVVMAGAAGAQAPSIELDRIQLAVMISPGTAQAMGAQSPALTRAVESALAARGMGSAVPGLPSRFIAYVDVVPLQEEMVPGGGMVAVKEQVTVTFGDREGGRAMGAFVAERTAVGRSKEVALRNLATALNLRSDRDWNATLDEANAAIIGYFEQQCPAILAEADAKMRQRGFDEAIYLTTTVPREARTCHERATAFAGEVYVARLQAQCSGPFAQARAQWAASKSRENAQRVADIIGAIPADSPCFADAAALMDGVAAVIAQADSAEAKRMQDEVAFERKQYEDQLELTRQQMSNEYRLERSRIRADRVVGVARAQAAQAVGVAYAQALAQRQPAAAPTAVTFKP